MPVNSSFVDAFAIKHTHASKVQPGSNTAPPSGSYVSEKRPFPAPPQAQLADHDVPEFAVVDAGILRTPHPASNRCALVPITSVRIYSKKETSVFDRKWSDVFFEQLFMHFDGWIFDEAWG
jgi:hypothetical protein